MAELGTVLTVDSARGICRVHVNHPDCGHCAEGHAGHCGRRRHELDLRLPSELAVGVGPGTRVSFELPRSALVQGLLRLLALPVLAGAGLMLLLWAWAERRPDPALWHGIVAVGGWFASLAAVAVVGQRPGEEPLVVDVPGGAAAVLRPWEPGGPR